MAKRIAIVGCGPAGLSAALLLSRNGHKVSVLERFDAPAAVGSGLILQPTGQAVLRELRLGDRIHAAGSRIDRIYGSAYPSGRVVLDVDYGSLGHDFHGLAVHRASLFGVLYDQALVEHIDIRTGVEITGVRVSRDNVQPLDTAGKPLGQFDLLVDASGARSALLRYTGISPRRRDLAYGAIWGTFDWPTNTFVGQTLEQRYVGAHTMIGVLPTGKRPGRDEEDVAFFWSLKVSEHEEWLAAGLDSWKSKVQMIWPQTESILNQIDDPSQMTLARYAHSTLTRPYGERIAYIGDSAHSTSPQLGQGANMALLDAWCLAAAIGESGEIDSSLDAYARSRRWHVRAFQLSSLAMTPFYQSNSRVLAALRDLLFNPVSKLPIARRIVAGLISGLLAGPPSDLDYTGKR